MKYNEIIAQYTLEMYNSLSKYKSEKDQQKILKLIGNKMVGQLEKKLNSEQ